MRRSIITSLILLLSQTSLSNGYIIGTPTNCAYVIAVDESLLSECEPLAIWRESSGSTTGIALLEDVYNSYPGRDKEEQFRNYLIAAYEGGLKNCLLIGDETNSPVRIASYGYFARDITFCQCDLYFSDLTGDWDKDNDGIWGTEIDDDPDFTSEIGFGRVPANTTKELRTFITKLLFYEKGNLPNNYKFSNVLSISVDQFVEQNNDSLLSLCLPSGWTLTKVRELPSGIDTFPYYPAPQDIRFHLENGPSWIALFAHGRADGISIKASGYGGFPKVNIYTEAWLGGSALTSETFVTNYPAIYVSASCDHGDFVTPGFGESMAENLLFAPGGALAFLAHSTKGWVNKSPDLVEAVFKKIEDAEILATAHLAGRTALPHYRMLTMSFNLYGDPMTRIWKSSPVVYSSVFDEEGPSSVSSQFVCYPNPSNGLVTIKSSEPINVFNVLGQRVTSSNEETTQLSNLQSGVFFVQQKESKITRKIVILK